MATNPNSLITMFNDFLGDDLFQPIASSWSRSGVPALNVRDLGDKYEISLSLPGIDPEKIKVEMLDKILNISYSEENVGSESGKMLRREWAKSVSFRRSLILEDAQKDTIEAEYERGVLTITINKSAESQPKPINIKVKSGK